MDCKNRLYATLLIAVLQTSHYHATKAITVNLFTREEQIQKIQQMKHECVTNVESRPISDKRNCPAQFDGFYCWPETKPNVTVTVKCPDYINMFNYTENASRKCMAEGEWLYNKTTGNYLVDYRRCHTKLDAEKSGPIVEEGKPFISEEVEKNLAYIQMVYTVGYSVSVISLIVALTVMLLLRRLQCPRNTIHMNMFVSYILRGGVNLLHDYLIVRGAYGAKLDDVTSILSYSSWDCKLLSTLWMYTRLSNCVWISIEGFYLHMLIFINTFSDKSSIKWFILAGWSSPLLAVIPWVFVRLYEDDYGCWTVYKNRNYRWIIEAPIVLLIVINFLFFLIILRLLFTKLRASESSSREIRIYRKLAKSTIVLIPLFGVHYMVFLFGEFVKTNDVVEVIRFYFDTFFTSFQGLMVGILFCFLNGEVRSEILKKWKRWQSQNIQFPSTQMNTVSSANQRTSIGSDIDSLAPARSVSRHSSLPTPPVIHEDAQLLLKFDDNQNLKMGTQNPNSSKKPDGGRS